jgi:hypothetical protein
MNFFMFLKLVVDTMCSIRHWPILPGRDTTISIFMMIPITGLYMFSYIYGFINNGCSLSCLDYDYSFKWSRCNEISVIDYLYKDNCTLLIGQP